MGSPSERGLLRTHICGRTSNRPKAVPKRFAPVKGGDAAVRRLGLSPFALV